MTILKEIADPNYIDFVKRELKGVLKSQVDDSGHRILQENT
jgi:hypothetical protein